MVYHGYAWISFYCGNLLVTRRTTDYQSGDMKLTKRAIDSFIYQGSGTSQDIRWDDQLPGFGLRIYPTGKKTFTLSYRANGRKHIMTIGAYGVLTLDQARDKAKRLIGQVLDGKDPLEDRKQVSQGATIKKLCHEYIERYGKANKKTWEEDQRRINRHIIPAWGNIKVRSIKRSDVASLHHAIGKTAPYEANRILALLSKIFELAQRWGFLPENSINPARKIDKFKERKRDRWLSHEELPRVAQAIDKEDNVYIRAAFWLYLLTGMRRSELLQVKWSEIDFERKEIRIPESKAGRIHYVPLSPPAIALIETIPKIQGNPYLLPGRMTGKPIVNVRKAWERIKKDAGVEGVRIHDIRRTVGSWLAQSGNSLHLIGKVLGHTNASTTQVYARLSEDTARKALDDHGKRIMNIAKGQSAGVVELPVKKQRKKK